MVKVATPHMPDREPQLSKTASQDGTVNTGNGEPAGSGAGLVPRSRCRHQNNDQEGTIATMNILRRNYDLVASLGTASVFVLVNAPWYLWTLYGIMVAYQIGNRVIRGWSR